MNKKQINKSEVLRVATALIAANGFTTSLDVKNQLRAEDFEARQNEVSAYLQEVANDQNYASKTVTTPTLHNEYSLNTAAPVSTTAPSSQAPAAQQADPGILQKVIDTIQNLFGYKAGVDEKFDSGQVTTSADMTDLLNDVAPQFGLTTDQFDSDFDPQAIIVWRDKTPTDMALFIGTLTNVAPPAIVAPVVSNFPANNSIGSTNNQTFAASQTKKARKQRTPANHTPLFVAPVTTTLDDIRNGYAKNAWVLFSTQSSPKMIYDGSITRDHVRSAYATKTNLPIHQIRARRVSNIVAGVTYKHLS